MQKSGNNHRGVGRGGGGGSGRGNNMADDIFIL